MSCSKKLSRAKGSQLRNLRYTLPETNSKLAPENGWLEDEFPFGMAYFQVRTVSFREGRVLLLSFVGGGLSTNG